MNRVQKPQSFAAKVALGGGARRDHATPHLKELGWLKLRQKYRYDLRGFIYNTIKGNVPSHMFPLPSVQDVRPGRIFTQGLGVQALAYEDARLWLLN